MIKDKGLMKSPNPMDPGNNLPVSTNNYRENLNVKIYISLVYDFRPCQAQMDDFPQMPGPNRVSGAGTHRLMKLMMIGMEILIMD